MYHIQTPPPTHIFDKSVSGISWVDLVFPIFIFCMGAAIPFAGRRRLEQGSSTYIKELFERFLMLWLFSYLYVFLNFSQAEGLGAQLATLAGFFALFPLYMVFTNSGPKWMNSLIQYKKWFRLGGVILIATLIIFGHYQFGEKISLDRRGIIIFLLTFLYLFGALLWYATRDSIKWRAVVFGVLILFSALAMYNNFVETLSPSWFFNLEYFYFLMILIPATYIGDLLQKRVSSPEGYNPIKGAKHTHLIAAILFALVVWQMVALYNEYLLTNFIVSAIVVSFLVVLIKRHLPVYTKETNLASALLLAGLISLAVEGSITKTPCTISYCFVTTSISIFLLMLMDYVSHYTGKSIVSFFTCIFSGAGSNPLMSYIAFGALLMPVFKLTGLIVVYQAAYPQDYPWIGVARAFIAVLLTMAIVASLSERKIFWRA
ncbi:MAG: hypothetical protein A2X18_04200 [Bacteroidetes bacterium GWF2_40_14]|nr:MAG: hypothetical protein A2X18_04200 [Bacteroidetes bacterium GWF2_40_14]